MLLGNWRISRKDVGELEVLKSGIPLAVPPKAGEQLLAFLDWLASIQPPDTQEAMLGDERRQRGQRRGIGIRRLRLAKQARLAAELEAVL